MGATDESTAAETGTDLDTGTAAQVEVVGDKPEVISGTVGIDINQRMSPHRY